MFVRDTTFKFTVTLKFKDDLPNGPYFIPTWPTAGDMYLKLSSQKMGRLSWAESFMQNKFALQP